MSPGDSKSRSSALAVFVNALSRKNHFQPVSCLKEKRALRNRPTSPLRPWDYNNKPLKNEARRNNACSVRQGFCNDSKRSCKKEIEKLVAFSSKSNNAEKERCDKIKHTPSEFVHHSDTSDYIKEYRLARHLLSHSERTRGSKEVQRAYDSLGVSLRLKQRNHEELRFSESSNGDAEQADNSKVDISDSEEQAETMVENDVIPRCAGDNDLHHPEYQLPTIPSVHSGVEEQVTYNSLLNLANATSSLRYQYAGDHSNVTRYRLSSLNRQILNNSGQRERDKLRYRRIELPKVTFKQEASPTSEKKTKKLSENRVKLAKKTTKAVIKVHSSNLFISSKSSLNLSEVNESKAPVSTRYPNESGDVADPVTSLSSSHRLSSALGSENLFSSDTQIPISQRCQQSVRDMLIASVKDLHPFSENRSTEKAKKEKMAEKIKILNKQTALEKEKRDCEISKQSISVRIYQSLMYRYKPSMRKLVKELYTPQKKNRLSSPNSYVLSGKPVYKLPPVKLQSEQVEKKSVYRRKLHHKKIIDQQNSALSLADSDHHQAASDINLPEHVMTLNPHTRSMETLAIIPNIRTVAKSQIFLKNVAC